MAFFNVVLLFITTRWMGAEVKGEISLLILNFGIATLICGMFGGPALVYLVPRHALRQVVILNYGWSLVATIGFTVFLSKTGLLQDIDGFRFFRMALLESLIAANLMILLGLEWLRWHNVLQASKTGIVAFLLLLFIGYDSNDFIDFINAYEISLIVVFIWSVALLQRAPQQVFAGQGLKKTVLESLKYGSLVQIGNMAQLLNYRLSYYFLELLVSPPQLALIKIGIYSAAIQVSESLWQFARSVSTVQYSVVSNMKDRVEGLKLSLQLARLNYSVTIIGVLLLMMVPASGYGFLFGDEFKAIKIHFIILSPGIIALALSSAFSHFFAGVGDHRFNTITSIFGLILTICLSFPSINYFSTEGAAAVASLVYVAQAYLQFFFLKKKDKVRFSQLILKRGDLARLKTGIKGLLKINS